MGGSTGGMVGWRGVRPVLAAVALTTMLAVMPAVAAEPGVDLGDAVVSPSSGLVDGSIVTISTTGATPETEMEAMLCDASRTDEEGCAQWLEYGQVDDHGNLTWQVELNPIIDQHDGTVTDCRLVACEVGLMAWTAAGATPMVRVPVSFDPDADLLPPPILIATPSVDLIDRQLVHLAGTGFSANAELHVSQCHGSGTCRYMTSVDAAADGTIDVDVAPRVLVRQFGSGEPLDCRGTAPVCRLEITTRRGDVSIDIQFDPNAELPPPPAVAVTPTHDLADGQDVTIVATGFDGTMVALSYCAVDTSDCDLVWGPAVDVDATGSFTVTTQIYSDLVLPGGFVDCRVPPGCEIRVRDWMSGVSVAVPVSFGATAPRQRYIDPVFNDVIETRDLLYRSTTDAAGDPIDLKLDIYRPAGDTVATRPAIVWLFGGWFMFGDKDQLADYARDAARRGFVGITIDYRIRPGMDLGTELQDAANDAYDDGVAAIEWLKANAATYGIDPDTIMSAGYSAGGVIAWNLAYLPPDRGPQASPVAGSVAIAGLPFAGPQAGDPPVLGVHAVDDSVVPIGPARDQCAAAAAVGSVCEWLEYETGGHFVVLEQARDIVAHLYDFLRRHVLDPRGYMEPSVPVMPAPPVTRPELPPRPAASTTTTTTSTTAPVASSTTTGPPVTSTSMPVAPPSSGPQSTSPVPSGSTPAGPLVVGGVANAATDAAAAEPVRTRPHYTG